jgi:hypothetical protein
MSKSRDNTCMYVKTPPSVLHRIEAIKQRRDRPNFSALIEKRKRNKK